MNGRKGLVAFSIEGLRRALARPLMPLTVWAANLLVALPAAVLLADTLRRSIGSSEAGERLLAGFDFGWHGELRFDGGGLVETFEPGRLVSGGWLANLDAWWSGGFFERPPSVLAVGALFAVVWILFTGGVLAHLHRPPRRFSLGEFLADGGGFFLRFLRLALISAPLYYGCFRLARWVFPRIESATQDVTVERTIFAYNLVAALVVVLLLATIKLAFDYAKIAIVVGERRSALLAAFAGLGFALRRPFAVWGLVAIFALLGAVLLTLRELVVPGVGESSVAGILGVFALGQAFLFTRLVLRLGLLGAELAFYEEEKGR